MSSKRPKREKLRRLLDAPAELFCGAFRSRSPSPTPPITSTSRALIVPSTSSALNNLSAVASKQPLPITRFSSAVTDADATIASLRGVIRVVKASVSAVPTITSIVDILSECLDGIQAATENHRDYEDLIINITTSVKGLETYATYAGSQRVTDTVREATEELRAQLSEIKEKQGRSKLSKYGQTQEDTNDLVRRYRRVDALLRQLNSDALMVIVKATSDARLEKLSPALTAKYNSNAADQVRRRGCTADTRRHILQQLEDWASDPTGASIYWMNGMAGTGKTTIAYSFCAKLEAAGHLAASFFCSRSLPECRNVTRIAPTIAYQLARFWTPYHDALCRALEQDPDAKENGVGLQWDKLVHKPMREVQYLRLDGPMVVVIDALDECAESGDTQLILECLLRLAEGLPIKYFVTCRPDAASLGNLKAAGSISHLLFHLHEVQESLIHADIQIYLTTELVPINATREQIDTIAKRSGTLFIYAATVVRYVAPHTLSVNHKRRLGNVLSISSENGDEVYAPLDALYTAVLSASLDKETLNSQEQDEQKLVLDTIICAREPLTLAGMGELLGFESADQVRCIVEPLRAVISLDETSRRVSTLHASFPDYMLHPSRAGRFVCNEAQQNEILAQRCFMRMNRLLHFNMCGLKSSFLLDGDVHDLSQRICDVMPVSLEYASRYWSAHADRAQNKVTVIPPTQELLQTRVMYWLELMNLKGWMTTAVHVLMNTCRWLTNSGASSGLISLCEDAQRFAAVVAASPVRTSTPHLYVSTLALWDRRKPMWTYHGSRMQGQVKVQGPALDHRETAELATWKVGSPVYSASVSCDGQWIATGSFDGFVGVRNVGNGVQVAISALNYPSVLSVACSPDGSHVAFGSTDGKVRVWNAKTGVVVGYPYSAEAGWVYSVCYSANGMRIFSAHEDGSVRAWDTLSGSPMLDPLKGHTAAVLAVACAATNDLLVSGSEDTTLRIWNIITGEIVIGPLNGHKDQVLSVVYSPDGTHIASASADCTVRIWEACTGNCTMDAFKGHTDVVSSVSFSPDSQRVASASRDHTIRVWDVHTGQTIAGPFIGHGSPVRSVLFTPDGHRLLSASEDTTVRVWDARAGCRDINRSDGHAGPVISVDVSHDSSLIVTGSDDHTIRIWHALTGQRHAGPFIGHTGWVSCVKFTPDGSRVVSGSEDTTMRIWDAHLGYELTRCQKHTAEVPSVAISPDGSRVASGSWDCTIRIWDIFTGLEVTGPLMSDNGEVNSVAYSPDGRRIVSGTVKGMVQVWDAHTGDRLSSLLPEYIGHYAYSHVAYSPDGSKLVSGFSDGTIQIWDAPADQLAPRVLRKHTDKVRAVTFSSDGSLLVSASDDCSIIIWDIETMDIVAGPFSAHTHWVCGIAASPDGQLLVSASQDGAIRVWNQKQCLDVASSRTIWTVNDEGWVTGGDECYMLWLPMVLRTGVKWPHHVAVVHRYGDCTVDFESAYIGESWAKCYAHKGT